MTPLSKWAIRIALIYFVATISLGALALLAKAGLLSPWWLGLRTLHVHLGFVGWFVQLVFGVGYWILPKFSKGPKRPRAWAAVAAVVFLNVGVLLSLLSPLWPPSQPAAASLEFLAAAFFIFHAWPRIKPPAT